MAIDLEHFPTNETALRMMERVSPIYDRSYVGKWIFEIMGLEMGEARAYFEELRQQPFPERTTWAIEYWERRYAIIPKPTDDLETRRRNITMKHGVRLPMNPARMEQIVEMMTGYPAQVTENVAPYTFSVDICIGPEYGCIDIGAVLSKLKQVKPSHQVLLFSLTAKAGIILKYQIDSWQYRVPECNTLRCGTWWMRHTLGWSERHRLAVHGRVEPLEVSPEVSGTLPFIKTPGYSLRAGLQVSGQVDAHPVQPQFTGVIRSGTEWLRRTLGWSEQAGTLAAAGRAEAHGIAPEFAGTLPELSKLGYTLVCGAVRTGGVINTFGDSPKEAGPPETAGTWPETATVGHSMAAGAVRAGGGVETFRAAPELAGTLPDEITKGYTIAGALTTGSAADGIKINPEYTGTLPEEAQHGERED